MRLVEFLRTAGTRLQRISDDPRLESRLLAAHVAGRPASWVLAHPDLELSSAQTAALDGLLERRVSGEPLPYLLGGWEFFGLNFDLTPDVLIPRPETELLIETAIAWASGRPSARAIDVGTGSGCIAVALAVHCPSLALIATDISPAALEVAHRNAIKHAVAQRIAFLECDLFPRDVLHAFDLILSNPPYIPTETLKGLPVFGREPTIALDGGPEGLAVISRLLHAAPLASGGMLLVEIESSLGPAILAAARERFPLGRIEIRQDLAGLDRLLVVET